MKDGGKPMGPTPAEKKNAEERAKQRQEEAALLKRSITDYAERLDLRDELAIIEKKPCWTDPMDQISQVFWTNNLKELRDLKNRMKAKMDEYLKKFKKEVALTQRTLIFLGLLGLPGDQITFIGWAVVCRISVENDCLDVLSCNPKYKLDA